MITLETSQTPAGSAVDLVVSDDALRSSVRLLLGVSGMDVREHRTARSYLATAPEPFRCLVVDCRLADMPGRRLCMQAVRHNEGAPIVVLTTSPEDFELAGLARPNLRIVRKPFNGDLLIDTIKEVTVTREGDGEAFPVQQDNRPAAL
jgi:FixJ family two-component response regulator